MKTRHTDEQSALGIVLVAYGHGAKLKPTLDAIKLQKQPDDFVILVDNHPVRSSAEFARRHPAVNKVIESKNYGFTGGCNIGAKAIPNSIALILLLNPDVVPQPGALDQIRRGPKDWEAWMGLLLLPDGKVNSAGNLVHLSGLSWVGGYGDDAAKYQAPKLVTALSGACLAIRREAWEKLGGLDETYFMYYEDADLSLGLRMLGKKIGLLPQACFVHDYEFTKGTYKWFYLERNRYFFIIKNWPASIIVALSPLLVILELGFWLFSLLQFRFLSRLHAVGSAIWALPKVIAARRSRQKNRAISSQQFLELLTPTINTPLVSPAVKILNPLFKAYLKLIKLFFR